jgi:hypothetical protein
MEKTMTRILAAALALTLALVQQPIGAQLAGLGTITGTASGALGPLTGLTVQVLDSAGTVVAKGVTTQTGAFSIGGLNPGTFTVQVLGSNGAVVGASSATLAAGAMTATVTVSAAAGALAAAASAAAAAAATSGVAPTPVRAAVAAAAASVGTAAVIATNDDASGSR